MCIVLLKRTYQLIPRQKRFRRILDQIDSHFPTFDVQTIRSEIDNLGKLCKEALKRSLKGKYISMTTDHWTSKESENNAVLTSHCIEGRKFRSCMLHFEHHRGRTRGEDIGREFSQIFDDSGFDLSYIVSVTTYTTVNMNTFCCYIQIKGVIHIFCVDHNIHLCTKLAFKDENISDSENIMKSARSLIEHFSSSTQESDKLLEIQKTISHS